MTVVHHGCGGHVVDGVCKACGRTPSGDRPTPVGVVEARAGLAAARAAIGSAAASDVCGVPPLLPFVEWLRAVEECSCPLHGSEGPEVE